MARGEGGHRGLGEVAAGDGRLVVLISEHSTDQVDLGGAGYGYCASHSRYFWGLRLHLVCTPTGLPTTFALTNPKLDERDVAIDCSRPNPAC